MRLALLLLLLVTAIHPSMYYPEYACMERTGRPFITYHNTYYNTTIDMYRINWLLSYELLYNLTYQFK